MDQFFAFGFIAQARKKRKKKTLVQQLISDHENETRLARYLFYLWGKISIQTNFKAKNSLLNWPLIAHTLTERYIKCNYLQPFQSIQILLILIASINSVLFWLEVVLSWQYYLLWKVAWQKAFSDISMIDCWNLLSDCLSLLWTRPGEVWNLTLSLPRSHKWFSLLYAIMFLSFWFREFGIGSPD